MDMRKFPKFQEHEDVCPMGIFPCHVGFQGCKSTRLVGMSIAFCGRMGAAWTCSIAFFLAEIFTEFVQKLSGAT